MLYYRDMDDWSLILLSCKVALEGKNTGEQVIRKGDPGNYAYIVLTGAVKVCPTYIYSTTVLRLKAVGTC